MDDWGAPRPPDWLGHRETLRLRLPVELVEELRRTARARRVSVNSLLVTLVDEALGADRAVAADRELDLIGL